MDWFQSMEFSGQLVAKAIIGGTVSEASGGKFANGAGSSAFNVAFSSVVGNVVGSRASNIRAPSPNAELSAKLEQKMMTELSSNEIIDDGITAEHTFPAYSARSLSTVPETTVFARAPVASRFDGIDAAYANVSATITATGFTSRTGSRGFSPGVDDVELAVGIRAARNFQDAATFAAIALAIAVEAPVATTVSLISYAASTTSPNFAGATKGLLVGRAVSGLMAPLGRASGSIAGERIWQANSVPLSFGIDAVISTPLR